MRPLARLGPLLPAIAALLLAAAPAPSRADERFAAAAAKAQRVEDLRHFLEAYVGRCTDPMEKRACEAGVEAFRRKAAAATWIIRLGDTASLVKVQPRGEKMLLLVTPFFDGGGFAITRGAPVRQDASGSPLVDLFPVEAKLAPGQMEMEFMSPFRSGAIEIELVFRTEGAWKLKRRGEPGAFEGVAARFLAIRILNARDGSEIGSRTF
jgi:hypothetical protein